MSMLLLDKSQLTNKSYNLTYKQVLTYNYTKIN